jgi:hypothetical protein
MLVMQALDLPAFREALLQRDPFEYLVLPGFVRPEACAAVNRDYPLIRRHGSFPVDCLHFGPAFEALLAELSSAEMREAFEEKFDINLQDRPTLITVRGQCCGKDGRIHTDTDTKIITVLIYMNSAWEDAGGRLRLLRSAENLDDMIVEVPPDEGTLVAFRRSDKSYHGHKPFVGRRRVIQLNWVTEPRVVRRELRKHRFSALMKSLVPFA